MAMAWVLGLRAQKGGAVALGVSGQQRIIVNGLLATHDAARPATLAPYAMAASLPRDGGDAAARALVAGAAAEQTALATAGLAALAAAHGPPVQVALIANRAGWIDDLLAHALGWDDHVPVVEALAVRAALRAAIISSGLPLVQPDEKLLAAGLDSPALAALGKGQRPWARVQKLAALAALQASN
jgi:hypothetical protein